MTKYKYRNRSHIYDLGTWLNNIADGKGLVKTPLSSGASAALGAIGGVAGQTAGKLIGDGMQSSAGDILGGLGAAASAIPGPWGAVASAGLGVLSGITNRAFGSKMNQENINRVENTISQLNSFNANANSFDDLSGIIASAPTTMSFDNSFIGKDGWFSSKAKRKANALREEMAMAKDWRDNSIDNNILNLKNSQMNNLLASYAAFGGPLQSYGANWDNGVTIIGNGGTHESNPYDGVPIGLAPDGQPNLVEEDEVIYNDYVFSNRLRVPKSVKDKYKLRGGKDMTFADAVKKLQKESEERPNDPISKRTLQDLMGKLMSEQEMVRAKKQKRQFANGGHIHATNPYLDRWEGTPYPLPDNYWEGMTSPLDYNFPGLRNQEYGRTWGPLWNVVGGSRLPKATAPAPETKDSKTRHSWLTGLRFVPALGASIGVFSDLMGWTNKPNYSNADMIMEASRSMGDVSATPIGDYLGYRPLDRLFYANQLGRQTDATRRSLLNTSGGNRGAAMSGILAADYNAQGQLGNLFRQAEEYNLAQREKVANFNRATNMFNSEQALKADIANRERDKIRVDAAARAAALRDQIDARVGAARSANLTNLFNSLGDIGIDAYNRADRDMLIRSGVFGTLSEKPQEWSNKRWKDYQRAVRGEGYRNGGKLNKAKGLII